MKGGENAITVSDYCAITREITVIVNETVTASDFSYSPIELVSGDYNCDSVINGKDYAYIIKNFTGNSKTAEINRFNAQVNFKKNNYSDLVLQ